MTRKRRSDFYRLRFKVGLTTSQAAELCGVTPRTIRNWDKQGAPVTAMRLLLFWDRKEIGYPGWEGFMFSRGALIYGRLRFRPETLRGYPRIIQELSRIEASKSQSVVMGGLGWRRLLIRIAGFLRNGLV